MRRDLAALEGRVHDLLVIGAGIYGACIARDAAQRGLKVALIERGDFGGATSHNSLKIIHGGLRYLQHLDLVRLRQSAREQRHWLKIAPHLVRPLAFVMPTFGHGTRGPAAMRAALGLHALVARAGAERAIGPRLPRGRILARTECLEHLPGLADARLSGGALWHEVQLVHADRVLLECVQDAAAHGAVVANRVAAEAFLGPPDAVEGVRARDLEGAAPLALRARLTINACGPFAGGLLGRLPAARGAGLGGLAKGMNLVTRRPLPAGHALAVSSRRRSDSLVPRADGRLYFLTPWQGRTVIGTSHLPYRGAADAFAFEEAEIAAFLAEINDAWPAAQLTRTDVLYCYAGLTPAAADGGPGEVRRARRGQVVDHGRAGLRGLISVQGVKYTTARLVAEQVVDLALARLGRSASLCRSASTPLPGAKGFTAHAELARAAAAPGTGGAELGRLLQAQGSGWRQVLQTAGPPPWTDAEVFRARVRHAVRHEMALHLEDVLLRRLEHAAEGRLSVAQIAAAAAVMAEELGWSNARRARELAALRDLLQRHRVAPATASPLPSEGEGHAA